METLNQESPVVVALSCLRKKEFVLISIPLNLTKLIGKQLCRSFSSFGYSSKDYLNGPAITSILINVRTNGNF
ncbi:hypothetical protein NPIL_659651 [Nephila pilipes]|uniref:Uncharacterized protein n=1 Tax=Nephila pilipes TaxID=299642 RepID=A0A8X6PXL9_NEPPI|nr:hypothetical protein NPIL_659651 [Nephila pilipes]